jgi:SP family arabinose:H+ symporter-like MFS transporter
MVMWIAGTIVGQLTPVSVHVIGSAGTFWNFSSFCIVGFFFIYRLLPETKVKSPKEIEDFWKSVH